MPARSNAQRVSNDKRIGVVAALVLGLIGACTAKVGERCDGFFANGCIAPASCIDTAKGAVCASGCSAIDKTCPDGQSCVTVAVEGPGGGTLPAGYYCLPTEMAE